MELSESVKSGIVVRTHGKKVWVKLSCETNGCEGCHIAGICTTQSFSPTLPAKIKPGLTVKKGDRVMVLGRVKEWFKGWLLMAGLPCIALLAGLILGGLFRWDEGFTGLLALGLVVIYYIILWLFRGKVDNKVGWIIQSIITD